MYSILPKSNISEEVKTELRGVPLIASVAAVVQLT